MAFRDMIQGMIGDAPSLILIIVLFGIVFWGSQFFDFVKSKQSTGVKFLGVVAFLGLPLLAAIVWYLIKPSKRRNFFGLIS